jgi:hypothetical protein
MKQTETKEPQKLSFFPGPPPPERYEDYIDDLVYAEAWKDASDED